METRLSRIEALRARRSHLLNEISEIDQELTALERPSDRPSKRWNWPLEQEEYKRYGRQMILEGFGIESQLALKRASILVVGAGGLGSPVLMYLGAAGVGAITIVDPDTVSISNLHRQIIHNVDTIGLSKSESAAKFLSKLNPFSKIRCVSSHFSPSLLSSNTFDFSSFDLIIDCTDNAPTRYLINDACVKYGKTLLSGAAIRQEGWVVVWRRHMGDDKPRGPCFRCVFPIPPSPPNPESGEPTGRCEDEGVLGTVTGVIGTLMAEEAIKLLTEKEEHRRELSLPHSFTVYMEFYERINTESNPPTPTMLTYTPLSSPPFRSVKLRPPKATCPGCGVPSLLLDKNQIPWWMEEGAEDKYLGSMIGTEGGFCGVAETATDDRKGVDEIKSMLLGPSERTVIIDVRSPTEFQICHLPESKNLRLSSVLRSPSSIFSIPPSKEAEDISKELSQKSLEKVVFVCKHGNDSLVAARKLKSWLVENGDQKGTRITNVSDLRGGLYTWSASSSVREEGGFPVYY